MKLRNRRKSFFANTIHRKLFVLVSLAALVPTIIVSVSLYYLIFNITAEQMGIPEAIAYNIIPAARRVINILLIAAPLTMLAILIIAYKVTHKIIGPLDRINRELNEALVGQKIGPIIIRKTDKLWPLVDKINKLLAQLNRER